MVKPPRKSSNKNPPILSHEFIVQNHADIVSCVAMVFVVGLMVQVTSPIASVFITLQHNITDDGQVPMYRPGPKDSAAVFFYSLICVVLHAILQEYVLDKVSKKLHLSKSKLSVFNASGQLAVFYLASSIWGVDIVLFRDRYVPDVNLLWSEYPPSLTFVTKLYLVLQLAYRLHELPELYFQRTKKEEYLGKASRSLTAFVAVAIPYFLNFNRLLICLLVLHHVSESIDHVGRLVRTVDKDEKFGKASRLISGVVFVFARLGCVVLAVVTLWFGLATGKPHQLDMAAGHYNIPVIRLSLLAAVLILQVYLTFNFVSREVARMRESKSFSSVQRTKLQQKNKDKHKKPKRAVEESDLPEVDQNTIKLRGRSQKPK